MSGKPLEGDVRDWLMLARADLAHAEANPPGGLPQVNCIHAQQATEKALKALLIDKGRPDFPYTQDLKVLVDMLQESGVAVPAAAAPAPDLTRYAVSTRYPHSSVWDRRNLSRSSQQRARSSSGSSHR